MLKRVVYSGSEGYILGGSHNIIIVEKWGEIWEREVDYQILVVSHIVVEKSGIFLEGCI